ncbi:MAG: hypothetical protein Q7S26_04500 [bacterium]|nr:hypothetical protein [bacterium]
MTTFITQNKLITGGVGIVVLGLLYYFFFMSAAPQPTLSTSTSATDDSPVTQSLLVMLSNLHTIKLDGSIFTDPTFISLTDFGVVIPLQSVGRNNPFAPLSGGAVATPANLKLPTSNE